MNFKKTTTIVSGLFLASCADMQVEKAVYVPEVKTEISYSLLSSPVTDSKEGLTVNISKSRYMDLSYKVNKCEERIPVAAAPQAQPSPAPAMGMLGLVGSLGALAVNTASSTSTVGAMGASPAEVKVIEKKVADENDMIFDVSLESKINHILSFEKSHFVLIDPNGKKYFPSDVKLDSTWENKNWCASSEQRENYINIINGMTSMPSVMVYPKGSFKGIVKFSTTNRNVPGDWKLQMFEIPVMTNAAGQVSVTDHFSTTAIVEKWETTFKKSKADGDFEKVGTKKL